MILILAVNLIGMVQAGSQAKPVTGKKIPILAWYGIPPEQTTLARYMELKESGITLNFSSFPDAEAMSKALDTARKAGIKMIVSCPELKTNPAETVRRFMKHPAVAGYMLRDEPCRQLDLFADTAGPSDEKKERKGKHPETFKFLSCDIPPEGAFDFR